jgi:hypothetical protein
MKNIFEVPDGREIGFMSLRLFGTTENSPTYATSLGIA